MLPRCAPTQKPYSITGFGETFHGESPAHICSHILGSDFKDVTQYMCYSHSYGNYVVKQDCEPAPLDQFGMDAGFVVAALLVVVLFALGYSSGRSSV